MNIGKRIKSLREERDMSQSQVEEKTKIKREYLSKIENGESKFNNPTYKTLEKIAGAFGMQVWELLKPQNGAGSSNVAEGQKALKTELKAIEKERAGKIKASNLITAAINNLNLRRDLLISRIGE
jgi:transcriptional regulator with XRE-family HTH domain